MCIGPYPLNAGFFRKFTPAEYTLSLFPRISIDQRLVNILKEIGLVLRL